MRISLFHIQINRSTIFLLAGCAYAIILLFHFDHIVNKSQWLRSDENLSYDCRNSRTQSFLCIQMIERGWDRKRCLHVKHIKFPFIFYSNIITCSAARCFTKCNVSYGHHRYIHRCNSAESILINFRWATGHKKKKKQNSSMQLNV